MYEQMSSFDEFRYDFCIQVRSYTEYWQIFFQSFARITVIYSIVNVTIIEIGWMEIWNGISEIPHVFFIIFGIGLYRALALWILQNATENDVQLTLYFRLCKWRSLCIWEIASYISSITNMYVLLDKFATKMQWNTAAIVRWLGTKFSYDFE